MTTAASTDTIVFDTEPLIAYFCNEPGSDTVETYIDATEGATDGYISAINLAEVHSIARNRWQRTRRYCRRRPRGTRHPASRHRTDVDGRGRLHVPLRASTRRRIRTRDGSPRRRTTPRRRRLRRHHRSPNHTIPNPASITPQNRTESPALQTQPTSPPHQKLISPTERPKTR